MQHKLLTLLLIVFGVVAVLGRSQIRFMNARFYSGLTVDITTDIYSFNQTSLAVNSRYSDYTDIIPATNYLQLPTPSIPEEVYVTFYAYNKDDMVIPVNVLANVSAPPLQAQSHTLVYVDQSDDSFSSSVTAVPAQLFIFDELVQTVGSFLKIVNVAVASYPYGGFTVNLDRYGTFNVPYGSDSGFLEIAPGPLNVTIYLPGTTTTKSLYIDLKNLTTTLYIRGDIAEYTYFGYNLVEHDPSEYWDFVPTSQPPVVAPVSAPLSYGPSSALVRYLNTYNLGLYAFALFDQNYTLIQNVTTADMDTGYQTLYYAGYYYISLSNYDFAGGFNAWLQAGMRYTVFFNGATGFNLLEDTPTSYNSYNQSYLRIVNNVPGTSFIQLNTPSQGWNTWYSNNGEIWYPQFLASSGGYGDLYISTDNQTVYESLYLYTGTATTIYLYGTRENVMAHVDQQQLPGPSGPVCVNGYVESNGVCNCYSGYATDNSSPYKCAISAPYYCFNNQTDALSNDYVPYIPYWSAQVYGNQLSFSVYSNIVANRRTLVELPNPQCSFINSPQYYQQYTGACQDRLDVNFPFTDCGFTKTSTSTEDVYKGTVHVKQIDRVTVGGTTYDRVIDTPMPIAIRMPKTLAVQSYVQVFGPPSLAIDAAFVGQTVSTETQSGNLQYVSSVQYPLQIETVQLVDLPYGVDAWIEVVNVNCSGVGPCVQRLEIHLNTSSCSISGVYRMVVSLSCRTDQGCPDEAKNGTQVYIESRIVSQSLCGEMSVDIDLNGYIQAFTDQDFTNPALAFYPGQSAYFLISAYSSRVSLSKVSIESVYYYGPNINYQYLSYNTSLSSIAVANNFTTGTQGNSQAWFGLDVSVSTPNSGDNSTLFKLYQGQNGVYNFVAIVDVEWYVANNAPTVAPYYPYQPTSTTTPTATPTATPPGPPIPAQPVAYAPTSMPTSTASPVGQSTPSRAPIPPPTPVAYPPTNPPLAKKRMVLQGSVSNQGSQFTAQVQVAGPTPSSQQPQQQQPQQQTPVTANPGTTDNKPVSSGVSLSSSLFVIAVALVALF